MTTEEKTARLDLTEEDLRLIADSLLAYAENLSHVADKMNWNSDLQDKIFVHRGKIRSLYTVIAAHIH